MNKKIIQCVVFFVIVFINFTKAVAQYNIPISRLLFHEKIDKAQEDLIMMLKPETLNQQDIRQAVVQKIDDLQKKIEMDNTLENNQKVKYLRGTEDLLIVAHKELLAQHIDFMQIPSLIDYYLKALSMNQHGETLVPLVEKIDPLLGEIIVYTASFQKTKDIQLAEDVVLRRFCEVYPELTFSKLKENVQSKFADTLIQMRAQKDPEEVYKYAAAINTPLGKKIQANKDPLVQAIAQLSLNNRGRLYFPFLDKMMKGLLKINDITKTIDDEDAYYKLLAQTQIEYFYRLIHSDTPIAYNSLTKTLQQKAVNVYINTINELHEQPDAIRFKRIDVLTPAEIYYLLVLGEDEIYTSSYLGAYKIMFQKMQIPRSDSLLMHVQFDHFRKCIKMAANYNTLDDFLKRMEKNNANKLMLAFVNGLDRNNSLEDAVDVANSYASITNAETVSIIREQMARNLVQASNMENRKGKIIYDLLNRIFQSYDSLGKKDISAQLGIPSVYSINNQALKDSKGRIVMQLFFYGDKDGIGVFNNFLASFNASNWKITQNDEWATVSSIKGTPITIFANKPLSNEEGLDAQAQANLIKYMDKIGRASCRERVSNCV